MATITIFFDPTLLPSGADASTSISADPAVVTLPVKDDSVPYFMHPTTGNFEVVTNVVTTLSAAKAIDVVFSPFDNTHPAVSEKSYVPRSSVLPHEDLLSWVHSGNILTAHIKAPTVVNKSTTYSMSTTAPPFLTIKVKRQ